MVAVGEWLGWARQEPGWNEIDAGRNGLSVTEGSSRERAIQGRTFNSGISNLLSVQLTGEEDFLLARQRAKQLAALLGFDQQDQTRIATAVSEIARNALEYAGGGRVEYLYDAEPVPQFRIVISDRGSGIRDLKEIWSGSYRSATGMGVGLTGTRRLLDKFDLVSGATGTTATLVKHLPARAPLPPSLSQIAEELAKTQVSRPATVDYLNSQNQELLTLLGELRVRETELQRLNEELAETNRGVLVLYAELEDKAQTVQQASEMKTRFLSGVTHELRTPLNSIVSLARLLLFRADGELNAEQEKQVQFILRSAQNLTELVNDLLDMAKIEAGKATINLSEFKLSDTLAGLRGLFRPLATNEQVKLIFDTEGLETPENPLYLCTDEGKLAQILRNFIANALKFTEQGTVTVSAKRLARSAVVFSVADTGVGIAPEHFAVVMQEWGQIEGEARTGRREAAWGCRCRDGWRSCWAARSGSIRRWESDLRFIFPCRCGQSGGTTSASSRGQWRRHGIFWSRTMMRLRAICCAANWPR